MTQISKAKIVLALTLFAVLIILTRIQAYDGLLGLDTVTYAIIGNELLEGRSLYSDLWDHKPPAVHLTFAASQALLGYGPQSIFFLSVAASILAMIGVCYAASSGGRGALTGLWAGAVWVLISRQVYLGSDSPNTEEFINVCVIWAFALFLRADETFRDWKKVLIAGVLFALASLYKPITVVVVILFSLVHLMFPSGNSFDRRRAFLHVLLMAAVGVGVWLMTAGYFFFQNRFDDFYYAVFEFNRTYAKDLLQNLVSGLQGPHLFPQFLYPLLFVFMISLSGVILNLKHSINKSHIMMAAYALSVFIMVALPGKFFEHYYQLWLPLLAVSTAWSLVAFWETFKHNKSSTMIIIGSTLLFAHIALQGLTYANYKQFWDRTYYGGYKVVKNISRDINSLLLPKENLHAWGFSVGLFYYMNRSPQTGLIATWPFKVGPRAPQFFEKVQADLSDPPVDLMVIDPWFVKIIPDFESILLNYQRFPDDKKYFPFELYYLKDSLLEQRLLNNLPLDKNGNR